MILPRALRSGDAIAVVAPASSCPREEFDRGVAEIARLGFRPVFSEAVFDRAAFSAGPPETRAPDFRRAWADDSIAALIAIRGGYGSTQLLPLLDPREIRRTPKLFIGYSDTTSLLSWLTVHCGVSALHGPMLDRRLSRGDEGYDVHSFVSLVAGGAGLRLAPGGVSVLREGTFAGPLYGGTLTQLCASLGTPYAFLPPQGAVLFLEDVNERPYKIDRMLTQLNLAGVLARAGALVFGEMPGCDEPDGGVTVRDAIAAATRTFSGPVLYGFPSGHTRGPLWTLPLGVSVRIETAPHPAVIVEEAPVG